MFLAKHFEFGFAFFLNALDARLDECRCGCNLGDVKNSAASFARSPTFGAGLNPGVQLSVVTEKLNVVTNGAPEKGRRYHTFSHTERALVATFNLSNHTNQNIWSICNAYTRGHTDIYTHRDIYTHTHIYTYARIYICLTILIISKNYTKANKSIVGWLNRLLVSVHNYILRIC